MERSAEVAFALFAIVVLSVAASGIRPTGTDGGRDRSAPTVEPSSANASPMVPALPGFVFLLPALLGVAFLATYAVREPPGRREVGAAVVLVGLVALALVAVPMIPFGSAASAASKAVPPITPPSVGSGDASPGTDRSSPAFLAALLLVLAPVAVLAWRRRGGAESGANGGTAKQTSSDPPSEPTRPSHGPVSGRPVENEVFVAWRELAARLDVADTRGVTPGEVAALAVDEGMDRASVAELTRLFEDVRYGDAGPSAERERRARAALDDIESGD